MENKKIIPLWLSVVLTLLSLASLVWFIYDIYVTFLHGFSMKLISDLFAICIYCLCIVYCANGYKKDVSSYYKYCCIFILLYTGVILYNYTGYTSFSLSQSIYFFLHLIVFGIFSIFVVAKDLGKKKSYILTEVFAGATLFEALLSIPQGLNSVLSKLTFLVLCFVFCIMIYAKYKDKEQRGAK